jgi:Raf kinase inhibitor-like YbhB/YbcL family protein
MKARTLIQAVTLCLIASLTALAQQQLQKTDDDDGHHKFQVSSTTFTDGGTLPLITVFNQCPQYPGGGDQSPELSWTKAPEDTRSFMVITYDVTASFTHWGMYNISPKAHELPQNAGVPGSPFGTQVSNDFGNLNYDGPCPPTQLNPVSHQYVFTVYALDIMLPTLLAHGDFPPGSEELYNAMIAAARGGHILKSASITGFFPQPQ